MISDGPETPLERLRPDGAAARRVDEKDVHLEAVGKERSLAGDQVVGGKLSAGGLGIDFGGMAQRGLHAENAKPGEAGERDDQRSRKASGEGGEGGLVALLLEGGHQHPGRAGHGAGKRNRFGAGEDRRVAAARDVDAEAARSAGREIVALERTPEAARLDAHDRVELRIELRVATEDLGGDRVGLDPGRPSGERLLDDVGQKGAVAFASVEVL